MTDVEKPFGFDLRDKRSDKSNSAKDWLPADALFAASVQSAEDKTDTVLVLWRERLPEGGWILHWRAAGPEDSVAALLIAAISRRVDA
jgi:hypothetical protein